MFGDWELANSTLSTLNIRTKRGIQISLEQITLKAEKMAVKFLSDQSLKWEPLTKRYVAKKQREGLSNKILIATSSYFQAITSQVEGNVGFAGVQRKEKNKEGQEIANIAAIHEFGSIKRNIPPRRLWSVVFEEMREFLIKENIIQNNIGREIRR